VNKEGYGDMYDKGSNVLNMVRTIINDDAKWRQILRGLGQTFYHQTVTTEQIVGYINQQSGLNLTPVFDQYLRYRSLPTLELRQEKGQLLGRWVANADNFNVPIRMRVRGSEYKLVPLTTKFQPIELPGATKDNIDIDTFNYYIGVLVD
jgi:aminopeptidase N